MAVPDADHGLVIFIHRLPSQVIEAVLQARLNPLLNSVGITWDQYELHKGKAAKIATLFVQNREKGEKFLALVSRFPTTLDLSRSNVEFQRDRNQDGGVLIRDYKFCQRIEAEAHKKVNLDEQMKALSIVGNVQQTFQQKSFDITTLNCGTWDYSRESSVFCPEYTLSRPGKLLIGHRSIVVILQGPTGWQYRMDFPWDFVETIYTASGKFPSVILTCNYCPKMYRPNEPTSFDLMNGQRGNRRKKVRIACLDAQHSQFAGSCLTYELVLPVQQDLRPIQNVVEHIPDGPRTVRLRISSMRPQVPFNFELKELNFRLSQSTLPFAVRFQCLKLATNSRLRPRDVFPLITLLVQAIKNGKGHELCSEAVRQLYRDLPMASPHIQYRDLAPTTIKAQLLEILDSPLDQSSAFHAVAKNDTLALIHHVRITPGGLYLEGPEPEVTNRVLRKYHDHLDCFLRVTFSDEDGEQLGFQFDTSNDEIYQKFQGVLDDLIPLCGKNYSFLGFSQSSLRSQTAWFMAPFFDNGKILDARRAIGDIGDFSAFRSPAKCAARIGQAFTDTNGFITLHALASKQIPDVERNGRVFSDGCGLMALDLATTVAYKYNKLAMREHPKVFQIRYQGVKGVLSVDESLPDGEIQYRESMKKFETKDAHDLEICSMADKPRPLYLNRGLIKVLEDLGVPHGNFLQLAKETIDRLQGATSSVVKAAKLLSDERVGLHAGFPGLMKRMSQIGIDVAEDRYLCAVVELGAFCRLRAMKYKGRIFVQKGVKLIGIMDETGYLRDGEIYCVWVNPRGVREHVTGQVVITRSPTNHPGDVQLATAVGIPASSSLHNLYNCVVFSQHGDRDLPSQLGGGGEYLCPRLSETVAFGTVQIVGSYNITEEIQDLDGDLYDVIWDSRIVPPRIATPGDYPRLAPIDIGRTITTTDITNHFIDFMKNDNIGLLANLLLTVSDRLPLGTADPHCLDIAELMSTALDYPKTGIVADIKNLPRWDKSWKPDFMAPGPKVKIEEIEPIAIALGESAEEELDDPVIALDSNMRKTRYYESPNALGKLYRMVNEKDFYEGLQDQTKGRHLGRSALRDVLDYAIRASKGFDYHPYISLAREIRDTYETNVEECSYAYALHSAHPLHEIEVVTGAVLGSVFVRRLRDLTSEMRERFGRDISYIKDRIRYDDEENDGDSLPRSVACLHFAVMEKGRKVGRDGHMWSWAYVAAAICLEEIERFHGGRLQDL